MLGDCMMSVTTAASFLSSPPQPCCGPPVWCEPWGGGSPPCSLPGPSAAVETHGQLVHACRTCGASGEQPVTRSQSFLLAGPTAGGTSANTGSLASLLCPCTLGKQWCLLSVSA